MNNKKIFSILGGVAVVGIIALSAVSFRGNSSSLQGFLQLPGKTLSPTAPNVMNLNPTIGVLPPVNTTLVKKNDLTGLKLINFRLTAGANEVRFLKQFTPGNNVLIGQSGTIAGGIDKMLYKNCQLSVDGKIYPGLDPSQKTGMFNIDLKVSASASKDFSMQCDVEGVKNGDQFNAWVHRLDYNDVTYIGWEGGTGTLEGPTFKVVP